MQLHNVRLPQLHVDCNEEGRAGKVAMKVAAETTELHILSKMFIELIYLQVLQKLSIFISEWIVCGYF